MKSVERKYGFIIFPETGERIDNVWLNITDKEIFLEVPFSIFEERSWSIITGVFNGFDNLSFIDVCTSSGSDGKGGSIRKFIVSWIIKGKHYTSLDQISIKKISIREYALKSWFQEDFYIKNDGFNYSIPTPIQPNSVKTENFELIWELAYEEKLDSKKIEINLISSIITKFNEPKNWSEIIEYILKLKKLLIFLSNDDPNFTNIKINDTAEIIFRLEGLMPSRFPSHIRLNYFETKQHLANIIKIWFDNKKLGPITDLILEKHFNLKIPSHRHFFNLAVGLEAFHQNFILKKVPLQNNDSKENRELILKAIESNEELYKFFNDKSSEWGKPNLKDRLFHLEDIISQISSYIFEYNTIELITKIKQTRDEIAHAGIYDNRFKENIELMIVAKIIEFVLRIKIYTLFGLELKTERTDMIAEANHLVKQLAILNDFKIQEKI